jgi:hypothetical protein
MSASSQLSELLYDLVLDPTILDLVIAMPELTGREIASTVAMLMAWDILTKPIAAYFWRRTRRPLSLGLFKLAVALKP